MKREKKFTKPYGLKARFLIFMAISALICIAAFYVLFNVFDLALDSYFSHSKFREKHIDLQGESLQAYIDENDISSKDLSKLKNWELKQPVIMLELYSESECIYSSFYDMYSIRNNQIEYAVLIEEMENSVDIQLKDEKVWALIYSDFTYKYYVMGTNLALIIAIVLFIIMFTLSNRKLIRYVQRLNEEVQILEGGNLEYQVTVEGNDEVTDLARSMNRMSNSLQHQIEAEQQIYKANRKLITEMSHDLRTPLTGIMLYMEILRSHRYETDEELHEYLDKISAKLNQMKDISDHLFEYTLKKPSESLVESVNVKDAFETIMKNLVEELSIRGYKSVAELPWTDCEVKVNSIYSHRVFNNVLSNISKYANPDEEIRIDYMETDGYCGFSIMNACKAECGLMESTGIGISSIKTMMEEMEGVCTVEHAETFFEITLLFKKA